MSQPTKAPWTIHEQTEHDSIEIIDALGGPAAEVYGGSVRVSELGKLNSIRRANAALIVAACNACQQINPQNPHAVATALLDLIDGAKNALAVIESLVDSLGGCASEDALEMPEYSHLLAVLARIEGPRPEIV